MIKKLQALKAKKGFTLVELVVVIAIIGVLAAILVPIMVGVVQDANITSANRSADSVANFTEQFRTTADGKSEGLRNVKAENIFIVAFDVTDGTWKLATTPTVLEGTTSDEPLFGGGTKYFWGIENSARSITAGTETSPNGVTTEANATDANCLQLYLQSQLSDIRNGVVYIFLNENCCVGAAIQNGSGVTYGGGSDDINGIKVDLGKAMKKTGGKRAIAWASKKAGVSANGAIIGTSPAIEMGSGS